MDRFTQFPVVNDDGHAVHVLPWQVDAQLPAELLAMSWAVLLRAFTTDDTPVFLLNGNPVKADLSAQTVLSADLAEVASLSVKHTAVVLGDHPSGQPAALLWTMDPTMQSGALHATGGMDLGFLRQLGQQLKQIVQEQAVRADMQMSIPVSETPTLSITNSDPATLPGPQLLHDLAVRGINDANHAIEFLAADGNIRCLSYEALDRLSSKLAGDIARVSTTTGGSVVVPVLLPQSVELYISWLGILKAGAAFCPLNTDAPPDRIEFILQDVAASVVITQDALVSKIPPTENLSILTVDDLESRPDGTEPCATTCTSSNLAYVMYTSGSTGRPKGVGVSHLAATQSLLAHDDLIPPFKRFLQFASPTFDVSVFEVFFPMMRGATLIGSERENMLLDISHVMTRMQVDAAELTPTVAGELLRTRAAAPSLRVLLTIGEMLTRHVVDEFGQSEGKDGILHGMYGPTEAAIHCTAATHFQAKDRVNMIGKPFKTVSAYIMSLPSDDASSSELSMLPLGQIGELVVGGPQLADGYINRPEENAKAFIDSPLYGRLYRTGDKARMLPNGDIECFGRISSDQVKLRGQRIELGEIEHVIARTEGVRSAVTIVIGGNLIAFVLVTGQGTTDRAIRDVCRQLLPRFMIPGEFVIVDQFPQLPSGKVDRKTLEADFLRNRSTAQSFDEELGRDAKEEAIMSCVIDVLGRRLASAESLASAGLDSLGAIRLASHLLGAGIRIEVATLLEADSVDGIWQLSTMLEGSGSTGDTQAVLEPILQLVSNAGAARVEHLGLSPQVSEVVPCSHIQQAMVLETVRNSKAYCNWIELEFEPSIGSASLKNAFAQLVQHNEILRSGFVEIGLKDQLYGRFVWNAIDEHISEQADLDYNVSLGAGHDVLNPFRVQIKEEKSQLRVVVHIHHALYDGWSWQLILNDLRDILSGGEIALKHPYNIVTNFFLEHKLDKSATESLTYWRDQLQGLYPASFPNFQGKIDVPPTTQQTTRILEVSVSKLNEITQHLRISRQTIFQAAFCYILSSYLGTDDVTFGTVFSGRTLPVKGIETVLGPCIRTLPTRMNLTKMQDVTDLLLAIQNMNRKSLEHGSLSLQDIKKASGIEPDRNLFDTTVVWQESIWSDDQRDSPFKEVNAAEFLEFALLLEFEPRPDCIFARATYLQSILPLEQATLLLEQIDSVASTLIDNVQLPIENIRSFLPSSTLSVLNAAAVEQVTLPSLASGVEKTATTNPSLVALELMLSTRDTTTPSIERVTYAELNTRANRLAHHLHHVGVTHTDLIGVLLSNSVDFYVAVLAVAKSTAGLLLIPHATSQVVKSALSTTESKLCIVDSESVQRFDLDSVSSVQQISVSSSMYPCHYDNPPTVEEGSDVAYVEITYNSDSIDDVVISRRNLESSIKALSEVYPTPAGSKILSMAPSGSGVSIFETFFAWHNGMALCSISSEHDVVQAAQEMAITHLHMTPTLASRVSPKSMPSVKYLLTSGEELTPNVHQNWGKKEIYQTYSSGAIAHICAIYPNVKDSASLRNIGKPLNNTSAMIVADQESFSLLPRGAIGELCFGGDQVGRSLSNSNSSYAAKFIEHPQYGKLYRTGDFARLLPDGTILLQKRGGTSLRAQLIGIDEVAHSLLSVSDIRESVSMILDSPARSQQYLVTFWIPSESAGPVQSEDVTTNLFKELGKKLPSSSMPSLLIPIDEIPLTRSNKTDFSVLKRRVEQLEPEALAMFSSKSISDDSDNSFTELEQTISSALSAVTGAEQSNIRKHTSFYRLGLDSLSAVSFSRKLQEAGCGRLMVSTILRHSSIAQLAAVIPPMINEDQPEQVEAHQPPAVFDETFIHQVEGEYSAAAASVQKIYPCTPLQEAMLAAESGDHSAYFNHLLLLVNTDADAMRAAWAQMMQRHDILRTCFMQTNDKRFAYAQVVLDSSALPWSHIEISTDSQLNDMIKESKSSFEGLSPINGKLPYSLTFITESTTQKAHLLLSIHHALYDGEGIAQLLNEVQQSLSNKELPVATPFYRFIDYMTSVDHESSDKYWDDYLSGFSPTLLPMTSANGDESASQQYHTTYKASFSSFKQQCKELSVTPLNIFHAAWARLLALYANSSDVTFGNVFSCRTVPVNGADRIVGPCFNTLPIRIKFPSTATNIDIMKLSQKSNSDILPHQLSPLRRIQRRILGGGSYLFDSLLIFQNGNIGLDSQIWELLQDEGNMGFPLICEIIPDEREDKIQICLHFQSSHISQVIAETIAAHFVTLIEHFIQYPSAQASDKRILGVDIPKVFEQKQSSTMNTVRPLNTSRQTRPWSAQESTVRDILCEFSDVESNDLSPDSTIFQLGLDSINAVQIAAKLRGMRYKISSGEILEAASIGQIAALLTSSEKNVTEAEFDFLSFQNQHLQSVCEQLEISSDNVQALRPCTPVQNGMLAMFTHSHGDVYFNRMSLKFSTPLNRHLLKAAWSTVMARHEMLRTGFVQLRDHQHPFAMITYPENIELPWHETTASCIEANQVLNNLHRPPWSIEVSAEESLTVLHFSALHAMYDAQSLSAIFADVRAAYENKTLSTLAPITTTLGPILLESKSQTQSAQGFWQDLGPEVHSSKFPDLHPIRSDKRKLLSTSVRCTYPRKVLEDACRSIGVTLQAAGQVAWARLLSAYTGESNVTFGTVLSGRNLSTDAQNAIFPCLVTVPTPLCIEGSNRDLLDRNLKRNALFVKNQFAPLSHVQRWVGSDEALFDTLFVYQKFASDDTEVDGWNVVDEETRIDYPVSIELIPHPTDFEIQLSYRSDIVPPEQAHILLSQYDKLLEDVVFHPNHISTDYASVGGDLLSVTPAKEAPIPTTVSLLHQFVEVNAVKIPEKIAFEFAYGDTAESLQKKSWTYRQFNECGNQIAHFLQAKGAVPGGMIGICFDKSPEASMAILGILKTGCSYLAIDPGAPISRKQFMLEDSGTKILLCNESKLSDLVELSGVDVQALDEPGLLDSISTADVSLIRAIRPDDTSYCLYTSGTTGTPKGCEITHDNAVQAMLAFQRLFAGHWDEDSRWLQFASFHFDVSVLEQYWSWSVGICVTSCPRDLLFEDLPGTIQKLQITHIDLTPSLAKLVHPDEVPSLCRGVFITGGEALKQEILDAWGKHGVIYNGYGPTEVTIGCTMLPRMSANDKASNIGPQFDNVGSYVFRPGTITPVLRGSIGELCVSGPLVGKGYLNRAELTKERFQTLPESGDRIYRTGDLVRILHDGSFQFLGRIDDQVKLRGQRLEIGEINEVIKQATPELNEVATLVITHPTQAKDQLVSFFTTLSSNGDKKSRKVGVQVRSSDDDRILLSKIKNACRTHLPGYMVPTHIIPMTRFPLSANNKADMKVLKSIYQELPLEDIQNLSSMGVDLPTDNVLERQLVSVLAKFIGLSDTEISSWSSIYEMGLDSISVIAFSRSLREAGLSQAQPSIIMKNPTIAGMASALQTSTPSTFSIETLQRNAKQHIEAFAQKNSHNVIEHLGVLNDDVERIAPCTPLQEGIIYHYLSSDTPLYCSSFTFELDSSVDFEALKTAWGQTQQDVQMLRARFSPSPDGYAQVILKKDALSWAFDTVETEAEIESLRKGRHEQWTARLDSLSSNLWEVGVISCSTTSVMYLNIFHGLYDGTSLTFIFESVAENYLSKKGLPRCDFLDVLHLGPLCKDPAAKEFWREHLADCNNRPLVTNGQESTPILHKAQINATEQVDQLRRSLNVTEQAVLHACWLLTLQQQYSFVPPLGIIASGRTIDVLGIENVIGPLFNTVPSNVQLTGLETWSDVARRCHEYQVSMMPFQYTALRDIVKWLGRSPEERLFDSMFVFQRDNDDDEVLSKSLWSTINSEAQHEYPLAFEIVRHGTRSFTATLAAKSNVVSSDDAQLLLSKFEQILFEFAQDSNKRLPELDGVLHAPVVTNGQIKGDRESFRAPEQTNGALFEWTSHASTIRDIIAILAGVEPESISEETSIFEIGLDSIDAIKISSRLGKAGIKLPVSSIMRHRTVKAMSKQLSMTNGHHKNGAQPLLGQMEKSLTKFLEQEGLLLPRVRRVLPATPIQEAMVAEIAASGYKHYYNHEILQLEPEVDIGKMEQAWRAVVRAHPILRTSFVEIWDPNIAVSYAQIIQDEDCFDVQTVHLHGLSVDTIIETQRSRARHELASRPLLSITIALEGDKRYLVLSISHALYDGWSINLLHEDVAKSYAGEDCSRPSSDDILEQIIESSGDQAFKFWRATLSNFTPASFLPMEHAGSDPAVIHRAEHSFSIPLSKAESFCKLHGITLQALLVTCWSLVLATHVQKLDVVFGLVLSGRNVAQSEHVMFPTMNTVAMRVILHGSRLELVKYVQEALLMMAEYQHFPLRRARPDTGSKQLFDTLFIYQKRPVEESQPGSVPALYKPTGGDANVEYPVCAEIEGVGQELVGRVACRGDVMGHEDTLVLLAQMADVVSSIVDQSAEKTIESIDKGVSVCGLPSFDDVPAQGIENAPLRPASNQSKWSSVESKIRNILSAVSGIPEGSITKSSTIFELGLDSISAIKVAALLKKQSIRLAVSDMLRAGTIENMAEVANNSQTEFSITNLPSILDKSLDGIDVEALLQSHGIDSQRVRKVFSATAGQSYFLSMHTLNPEVFYPEFYYMASRQLSRQALDSAWTRVIEQTPMLRTAFLPVHGPQLVPYIQIELEAVHIPIIWHSTPDQLVSENSRKEFGAVPVALRACQTTKGTALNLQIHHALYDAVSLPHILSRLVAQCSQDEAIQSQPDLDLSHLVAFQHVHSPVHIRRQFWQKYLGQIPTHQTTKRVNDFGSVQQYYRPGLVPSMACVEKVAKRQGLSIQTIFLAIYARIHAQNFRTSETAGHDESGRRLTIGLYLANRSHSIEGLAESVIPTVNIVPLRLDDKFSDTNDSLLEAARRIQTEINEISRVEYSGVSLLEIAEWTGVHIDTCVNFLRLPEDELPSNETKFSLSAIQREELSRLSGAESTPATQTETQINGNGAAPPGPAENKHPSAPTAANETVYQPTIDVEAAIRDGRLDFGLFAPESRLSSDCAECMIDAMRREMDALVTGFEL
ncbi:uncharacterized protein N7511_002794 [Penicillium nucicola]|uniref:uncharacterized protein n=1 Tax=Penicillium nucicola TaxID=1850975 RepID=UPI002545A7CA|nr:uncharacterized protein N7511_002794 [Penicillium nucicola]KAJ5770743.1 hypothetical protein N7511_002794 [Penicillium nucicola]